MCNRSLHSAHRGYIPRGLGNLPHHRLHHPAAVPVRRGHSQYGHWFWVILSKQGLRSRVPVQHRLHLSQCFLSQCLLSPPGPQLHLKKLKGKNQNLSLSLTECSRHLSPPTRDKFKCANFMCYRANHLLTLRVKSSGTLNLIFHLLNNWPTLIRKTQLLGKMGINGAVLPFLPSSL